VVGYPQDNFIKYRQLFLVLDTFILIYLPKSFSGLVLIIYDVIRLISKAFAKLFRYKTSYKGSKAIYKIAMVFYLLAFACAIYGFVYEKTNFKVQKIDITFDNLPESFDGFTMIQISDLHMGSYSDIKTFRKAVEIIKGLKPDALFMTGDIINVTYKELEPYITDFKSINPPYGKFSILGNHDIGDYFTLKFPDNQEWLTRKIIETEKKAGFRVLIDTTYYLHKGKDSIAILGVNNCGTFPFKQSGNLKKAMLNTNNKDFKILLSHDPDHWQKEVTQKTNIDLTFSGHTHAMQLALIWGKLKLSPSALKYENWYGLYNQGVQYLYVNPGLGFSGFSGRIGIRPEITLITLHCSK
jgi:predicted MPP superfamily phosphohydrolase